MKNTIGRLLLSGCLFWAGGVTFEPIGYAHSNHKHKKPASAAEAESKTKETIKRLIKEKKIVSSWASAGMVSLEKKTFNGKKEWLAIYLNPEEKVMDKKRLYIFLKESGAFLAANFTGK